MSSDEASSPNSRAREPNYADYSLAEYIDEFRDELEAVAEETNVVSPIVQALLDRRDRGEIGC